MPNKKNDDLPRAWSGKDKRKYEHIKEGYEERGTPERRAKRIAGQTVNKGRREEGRTKEQASGGSSPRSSAGRSAGRANERGASGSRSGRSGAGSRASSSGSSGRSAGGLEQKPKAELYDMAKRRDIGGRSKMNKQQLVRALRKG